MITEVLYKKKQDSMHSTLYFYIIDIFTLILGSSNKLCVCVCVCARARACENTTQTVHLVCVFPAISYLNVYNFRHTCYYIESVYIHTY